MEAKRLKALEDENTKLKGLLTDAMLDNVASNDLAHRLGRIIAGRSKPKMISATMEASSPATRSCNGGTEPEADSHYITPGKPVQKAFIESSN